MDYTIKALRREVAATVTALAGVSPAHVQAAA